MEGNEHIEIPPCVAHDRPAFGAWLAIYRVFDPREVFDAGAERAKAKVRVRYASDWKLAAADEDTLVWAKGELAKAKRAQSSVERKAASIDDVDAAKASAAFCEDCERGSAFHRGALRAGTCRRMAEARDDLPIRRETSDEIVARGISTPRVLGVVIPIRAYPSAEELEVAGLA